MVDKRLIQLLSSSNVENRKKAVMALAKTKDREALPYLAKVFKSDQSSEVRELAKKAGAYIAKNAPQQTASVFSEPDPYEAETTAYTESAYDDGDGDEEYSDYEDDSYDSGYSDTYDTYADEEGQKDYSLDPFDVGEDEEQDDLPLPSEIEVSESAQQRAQGYLDQAMDLNLRGDNRRAENMLRRAVQTNPKLAHDGYTRSLAATITGRDGDDAMREFILPAKDTARKSTRVDISKSPLQTVFAFMVFIASAVALVGYFILPWVDLSSIPVEDTISGTGQSTLGEQMNALKDLMQGFGALAGSDPQFDRLIDAVNGLTIAFNGLDTTLLSLGIRDIYEVMGFNAFIDVASEMADLGFSASDISETQAVEPRPLDYTLPLMPVMAILAAFIAFASLSGASIGKWVSTIIIGLIGIVPLMYFYLDTVNSVFDQQTNLGEFGEVVIDSATKLLGSGYWLSIGGMLAILILPFLALLLAPGAER